MVNDVGQPLAAGVLALYRLVGDAVGDDEEDFGEVGVVRPEDDGVVAAAQTTENNQLFFLHLKRGLSFGGFKLTFR